MVLSPNIVHNLDEHLKAKQIRIIYNTSIILVVYPVPATGTLSLRIAYRQPGSHHVTSASSISVFRKHLKTHLFSHSFHESLVVSVHILDIIIDLVIIIIIIIPSHSIFLCCLPLHMPVYFLFIFLFFEHILHCRVLLSVCCETCYKILVD